MAAGVSLADFQRLTPAEAAAVIKATADTEDRQRRDSWERCRTAAVFAIMPHLKRGASRKPHDLLPLPWDGDGEKKKEREPQGAPALSREQARERYRRLTGEGG